MFSQIAPISREVQRFLSTNVLPGILFSFLRECGGTVTRLPELSLFRGSWVWSDLDFFSSLSPLQQSLSLWRKKRTGLKSTPAPNTLNVTEKTAEFNSFCSYLKKKAEAYAEITPMMVELAARQFAKKDDKAD